MESLGKLQRSSSQANTICLSTLGAFLSFLSYSFLYFGFFRAFFWLLYCSVSLYFLFLIDYYGLWLKEKRKKKTEVAIWNSGYWKVHAWVNTKRTR